MGPIEVRFETETTAYKVDEKLQALLDELYKSGVLKMKGTVKLAKVNIKPYYRNTFEVFVVFDE